MEKENNDQTYRGTAFADKVEKGVTYAATGLVNNLQKWSKPQEGIHDDVLRFGGKVFSHKLTQNVLKIAGAAGEAGGYVGSNAAKFLNVDPRIGGAIGSFAADAALGFGVGKAAKIGKTALQIRKLKKAGAGLEAFHAVQIGKNKGFAFASGPKGALKTQATMSDALTINKKGRKLLDKIEKHVDAQNALKISPTDKAFYPQLKPHRSYKTTSKLKTVEDYKQAWRDWPDKTETGRDAFYKKEGHWITEENFKLKPTLARQTPAEKAAGIKRFGKEISDRSDYGVWTRKQRGDVLTYMSDEVPISTKKAGYTDPVTGHKIVPHHRTSHGELAPWVDVIINKLNSPNPKIKAEGKHMMEIGKDVFKKNKIKVGDTLKNYEGYFDEAHLGPGSIHDLLKQHKITGPSSRSAFDFTQGKNIISKGVMHKGKHIPTKDYIRMLPWKPASNIGEFGQNTFWSTLVDYIQFSNMPRQTARKGVISKFGRQGKNWAAGKS